VSASETTERITAGGIIAVIRLPSADALLPSADALRDGGLTAIEFTLTSPGALNALERARARLGGDILLGVGTVLTADQARDSLHAGADFLVAPNLNPAVVRAARDANVAVVPGAFTPTEIVQAWELGASLVKVFPVSSAGPRYLQELRGPLPHIPLVPMGGVTLENAGAFIRAGAAALGVEGELVSQELLERKAFREVTARAREFADTVARARGQAQGPVPPVKPIEGPDTH
jgi:2-dehydro-3-deoxyphosphogluconate aldolase / (4S)-4-hydroxy-2-oxoglutarate aldolase